MVLLTREFVFSMQSKPSEIRSLYAPPPWCYALIGLLVVALSILKNGCELDDALIYARYVKNFHDGHGLVYNVGEYFNGLTSPLYTYALIAVSFVTSVPVAAQLISAVCLFWIAVISGRLFSNSVLEFLSISTFIAAGSYFYSVFGMETPLYLALIATALMFVRSYSPVQFVVIALAMCTRTEAVFLLIPATAVYWHRHRAFPPLWAVATCAVILIVPYAINWLYYGHPVPDSASAKIGQGKSGLWGEHVAFFNVLYFVEYYRGFWIALGILVLGFYRSMRTQELWNFDKVMIFFLISNFLFYAFLNIPSYHWYFGPFVLYGTVKCASFASVRLSECLKITCRDYRWWRETVFVSLIYLSLFLSVDINRGGGRTYYQQAAAWLQSNTPTNSRIACVEIGTIGWYTDRSIVDILGLVSRYNSQYIAERQWFGWLLHYQPDYILRHEPTWKHEQSVTPLETKGYYVKVADFNIDGLVLLQRSKTTTATDVYGYAKTRVK